MGAWLLVALAIVLETVGTAALKSSGGFSKAVPSLVVVVAYCGAFGLLGLAVRTLDIGLVYAIWAGVGTVAIALVGVLAYAEPVTRERVLGIALVAIGVVVLNRGGH